MSDALLEPRVWSCLNVARYWCRMSGEEAKLKLKIEQAEAAVARAQKVYDEAEPGSVKDSCLQLLLAKEASLLADKKALDSCLQLLLAEKASLLAKEKALEQVREKDLLQQRAAAGAGDNHS